MVVVNKSISKQHTCPIIYMMVLFDFKDANYLYFYINKLVRTLLPVLVHWRQGFVLE